MTEIKRRKPKRGRTHGRTPRVTDTELLDLIAGHGDDGVEVKRLAEITGYDRSTVAYRLGCLEIDGRVERVRGTAADPADRWRCVVPNRPTTRELWTGTHT